MRPLIAAVCLLLLIAAPVGAQSGSTLEERVAALEAQVAELRALHDLTEPEPTPEPTEEPTEEPTPEPTEEPAPEPTEEPAPEPEPTVDPEPAAYPPPSTEGEQGSFRLRCKLVEQGRYDPIVAPGSQPFGHLHDFFGGEAISPTATAQDMIAGGTTCGHSGDTAGYWSPSLVSPDGEVVVPRVQNVYYRNQPASYGTTTMPPLDLRMIAPMPDGLDTEYVYWTCNKRDSDTKYTDRQAAPPDCTEGGGTNEAKLHVWFPPCWDGKNLDSADHRSHMAYALDDDGQPTHNRGEVCPPSHPVKIPQVNYRVIFPVSNATGYVLSDGKQLPHADFWQTWKPGVLEGLIADCLHTGESCGAVSD